MKLYLYITNADDHMDGNICYHAIEEEVEIKGWILAGTVEFEPEVSQKDLLDCAIENLDEKESELRAQFQIRLDSIEEQKQKLLSLPHLKSVTA